MKKIQVVIAVLAFCNLALRSHAQLLFSNGLVAYYPLNGNANDASGNSNNGVLYNVTPTNSNTGLGGGALYFNGTSGSVLVTNNPSLNLTNISLSAWIKPDTGYPGGGMVFSKHESGVNADGSWWLAPYYNSGSFTFFCNNQASSLNGQAPDNAWTHCVFTYDNSSTTWKFYINGVANDSGNTSFTLGSTSWPLRIGAELQGDGVSLASYFKGSLDNLRIYNRVLSSNEVAQLYAYEVSNPVPLITQNLTNSFVVASSNFTFNLAASSTTSTGYQWYFSNGIAGQAGAYAQTISGFVYNVVVTNGGSGYGAAPSVSFTGGSPTTPAAGVAVVSNGMVTGITVTGAGSGYTSVPNVVIGLPNGFLAGQTNSFLAISNASTANAGNYYVIVTNTYGSVTSSVVSLTILFPPAITNNPTGFEASLHGGGILNVGVSGTTPLAYQWLLNGTNIAGATAPVYTIASLTPTNAGAYSVQVTNPYGAVTSVPVNVVLLPSLTMPFMGAIGLWGQNTTLSVGAVASGTLSYQWYFDGAAISGATSNTYTLGDIQFTNAGLYSVVVSSPDGSVTNAAYQVVVNPANIGIGTFPGVYITGTVGYSYTIQSTTNLADTNSWVTQTNLTLTSAMQIWFDGSSDLTQPQNPRKFYRILAGQ